MKEILFLDLDGTLTETRQKSLFGSFSLNFMPTSFFDLIRLLMKFEVIRFLFSKLIFYLNIFRDAYINKEELSKTIRMINKLRKKYLVFVITNRKSPIKINSDIYIIYCRKYRVPKPSMIILSKILKTLKWRKCIFVGDSIFIDIFPAMNIGCKCFWISKQFLDIIKKSMYFIILKKFFSN